MIHPKVTEIETPSGSVLDLFSYEDKRYCHQISFELCWANVFEWESGKIVTLSAINNYFK